MAAVNPKDQQPSDLQLTLFTRQEARLIKTKYCIIANLRISLYGEKAPLACMKKLVSI